MKVSTVRVTSLQVSGIGTDRPDSGADRRRPATAAARCAGRDARGGSRSGHGDGARCKNDRDSTTEGVVTSPTRQAAALLVACGGGPTVRCWTTHWPSGTGTIICLLPLKLHHASAAVLCQRMHSSSGQSSGTPTRYIVGIYHVYTIMMYIPRGGIYLVYPRYIPSTMDIKILLTCIHDLWAIQCCKPKQ